jgi:hypothetical protein
MTVGSSATNDDGVDAFNSRRVSRLQVAEVHHAARRACSSYTDVLHDPSMQLSGIHHHTCESGVVTTPLRLANSHRHGHRDSFLRTAELSSASFIALSVVSLLLWYVRPTSNNLGSNVRRRMTHPTIHPARSAGTTVDSTGPLSARQLGGQYQFCPLHFRSIFCCS